MSTQTIAVYTITQDILNLAMAHDACKRGIKWIKSKMGKKLTKEDIFAPYGLWMSQYMYFDSDEINYWIEKAPACALKYADDKLTIEQRNWCFMNLNKCIK